MAMFKHCSRNLCFFWFRKTLVDGYGLFCGNLERKVADIILISTTGQTFGISVIVFFFTKRTFFYSTRTHYIFRK